MKNQYVRVFFATIALVALQPNFATAQVSNWQPSGSNVLFWNTTNWDNGIPGTSDEAVFGLIGPFNVDMDFDATIGTFTHAIGTMTLLGGNALEVVNSPDLNSFLIIANPGTQFNSQNELLVGEFELGGLTLLGGADSNVTGFAYIGSEQGIEGRLTINGSGSKFTSQGLTVGDSGEGNLLIQNNGRAICEFGRVGSGSTSTGQATVTGTGSRWENTDFLAVGASTGSNGVLDIENSGVVVAQRGLIGTQEDADGTINVTGAGSTLSIVDRIEVGNDGLGSLNASIGGLILANECRIGRRSTASGIVNLESGAGMVCSSIIVGREGSGGLNIGTSNSFATVNCNTAVIGDLATGSGFVNVQGANSNWDIDNDLRVGNNGSTGLLIVQDGASVDVSGDAFVNGDCDLDSVNSELVVSGLLEVGVDGTMNLFDGSVVVADLLRMFIPSGPGGTVVAQFNSTIMAETVEVGGNGGGVLNLTSGSLLDCGNLRVLDFGYVSMSGAGTAFVCDGLQADAGGTINSIFISDSGVITVMGETTISPNSRVEFANPDLGFAGQLNCSGTTEVEGGILFRADADINGELLVSGGGEILVYDSSVAHFTGNYANFGARTLVDDLATLNIIGDYSGTAPFQESGTVNFHGDVQLGTSTSTAEVTFEGDVTLQGSAKLGIQIGGLNSGEFDQLLVEGDITLNGDLDVTAVGGFQPLAGQQFTIVQTDGATVGTFNGFAQDDVVASVGNVDLEIDYFGGNGNDVCLVAVEAISPGDLNGDGVVNLLDVQPFINALSSGQYVAAADINMDGVLNLLDVQPFIDLLAGG